MGSNTSISRIIIEGLYTNRTLVLMLILLTSFGVTPILNVNKLIFIAWFVFIIVFSHGTYNTDSYLKHICFLSAIYLLICVIYKFMGISSSIIWRCILPSQFFFATFALLYIDSRCTIENIRLLFHVISFLTVLNIADSIRLSMMYPMEIAYQSMEEELEMNGVAGLNLGGSMFVNMTVFFGIIMFFSYLKSNSKNERFICFLYFSITMWFLIMCSQKASAIIIVLLGVVLMYIIHTGSHNIKYLITLFVVFAFILYYYLDDIIFFLIDMIGSRRIADRLMMFTSNYSGGTGQDDFAARANLWSVSLQTWLRNPVTFFMGIGDHSYRDFISTSASGIGNHSDFLDVFARYGIIGGGLLFSIFYSLYKYLVLNFAKYKNEILVFFIILIFMGFTKKFIAVEPAIPIFILFPIAIMYLSSQIEDCMDNTFCGSE